LGGERITLEPEALLLDARSPEGFAAVEDRGYLVALDTTLTPALVREGLARDAVRLVQDARKQAGLDVSDRIELWLRADDATAAQAIAEYEATLRSETLARGAGGGRCGAGGCVRVERDARRRRRAHRPAATSGRDTLP
jgi:isoleucyl-tRNA synthetase